MIAYLYYSDYKYSDSQSKTPHYSKFILCDELADYGGEDKTPITIDHLTKKVALAYHSLSSEFYWSAESPFQELKDNNPLWKRKNISLPVRKGDNTRKIYLFLSDLVEKYYRTDGQTDYDSKEKCLAFIEDLRKFRFESYGKRGGKYYFLVDAVVDDLWELKIYEV